MSRAGHLAWPAVTISEERGVRYLHLDSPWVQGAMRISKPDEIELEYVRRMMVWLLWRPFEAWASGRAVQLGLGAAAITRFCHGRLGMPTTAVELNPGVIRACRSWFGLPEDGAGLEVVCADAGRWIASPRQARSVAALQVDLYDHEAAAPVLDDQDFYGACRRALEPGGVMVVNLFGRNASFERSSQQIAAVFGRNQVWRVQATREGNTVVVAAKGVEVPDRHTLTARARQIESAVGLPARRWLQMVRPL